MTLYLIKGLLKKKPFRFDNGKEDHGVCKCKLIICGGSRDELDERDEIRIPRVPQLNDPATRWLNYEIRKNVDPRCG